MRGTADAAAASLRPAADTHNGVCLREPRVRSETHAVIVVVMDAGVAAATRLESDEPDDGDEQGECEA
ncbi:hypothetical protein GCM10025768_22680 [Microbacterium pseudoresistens]